MIRRLLIIFTIIFLALLAVDGFPFLRGGAGWQWPYELPDDPIPALILALVLLAYLGAVYLLRRFALPAWAALTVFVIGGAIVTTAAVGVRGDAGFLLFTRTVSPVQTGASTIAVNEFAQSGTVESLRRWPEIMRDAYDANLIHFTTSPPGQPLLHHGAARMLDALPGGLDESLSMPLRAFQCSDANVMSYTRGEILSTGAVGMLMPLWAALIAVPVFFAGRGLTDSREAGLRAASWSALIPAIILFAPTWNTLYPFLCATVFALLLAGLRAVRGPVFALGCAAAGLVMALVTLLNFAVLPVLLLLGLFTLGYWYIVRQRAGGFAWPVLAGVWFGLGLALPWLIFGLVSGWTPFDLLRVTFDAHTDLVQRDYLPWLIVHPYDVLMFAGWPLAGLFLWGCWRAVQRWRSGESSGAGDVLALSMLVTLALVNVAGVAQGENARILSYYAPFFILGALGLLARGMTWDLPLLSAQALTVFVMAVALPVVPLDLNEPPAAPRADVPALDMVEPIRVDAAFSSETYPGAFTLDAQRFVADLGERVITLEMHWRGAEPVERPYEFEIIARAENDIDGQIITEPFRWRAQNGNYLPTCWRADDVVRDVVLIPLPGISAGVVWELELRAIDPRTGDRMRVTLPDGSTGDHAPLGPVNYP